MNKLVLLVPESVAQELTNKYDAELVGKPLEPKERDYLAIEVDKDKAESIMGDLSSSIDDLIEEVGYPGPNTDIADSLKEINDRLSDLENELDI